MGECTENATRTIARLLYIIAFGWFINFRMKLLFGTCMTILAIIAGLTIGWFAPFFAVLYIRTRCWSIFKFTRTSPLILAIMILWTRVALSTQARWPFARFRFIIGQYIVGVLPLWILVHQAALFVKGIWAICRFAIYFGILSSFNFFNIVYGWALIMSTVRKCTMMAIFYTIAAWIGVMHTHARFIIA